MPMTMCQTDSPRFSGLFPDWDKPRPIRFYLMENLLESRMGSVFPTGGDGYDEDVNVYVSHLLSDFINGNHNTHVKMGAGPLMEPPAKSLPLNSQVEYYRANADHRLLYLGLMDRGDGLRRRRNPLHRLESLTRQQDLVVGSTCYGMAANLLSQGPCRNGGLAQVMRKLERNFTEYVQVISALATGRLNLGARLTNDDLQKLVRTENSQDIPDTATICNPTFSMDDFLDTMLAQKKDPQAMRQHLLKDMARQLGVPGHMVMEQNKG
jgi:hypothetical protein